MPDINFGILQPLNQISPIRTMQTQAPSSPNPSSLTGMEGLQGILGGLKNAFGHNPVSATNAALTSTIQNTPSSSVAQTVLNNSPAPSSLNLNITNSLLNNNLTPNQVNNRITGGLSEGLSIDNIRQMAAQTFPNDPIRQQLAVAQATQESGLLTNPSKLARQQHNLFGMTGKGNAGSIMMTGNLDTKPQQFAAYKSLQDSMNAYKETLNNPRYKGVLQAKDFNSAAMAVQKGGYAEDPHYARQLMAVNDRLSKITSVSQAHELPTPNIKDGAPIPREMENTPAFHQAITSYASARQSGITKSPYVVSVDFSQPASAKRLSVINAETGKVVLQSEVAQGKTAGFSNIPGSHQSSLGTFQTTQVYDGKHGMSLRIKGLDKGVNDNAESRDIVVHGADYIGNGKTGHSFGCFAVPSSVAPKLINLIKDGSIINAYGPKIGPQSMNDAEKYEDFESTQPPQMNPQNYEDMVKKLDKGRDSYA